MPPDHRGGLLHHEAPRPHGRAPRRGHRPLHALRADDDVDRAVLAGARAGRPALGAAHSGLTPMQKTVWPNGGRTIRSIIRLIGMPNRSYSQTSRGFG